MKKDLKEVRLLEKEKSQGRGPKTGVCLACLWNRREASVWSGVSKGENCSHYKDLCFVPHEMGRHARGWSRQVT